MKKFEYTSLQEIWLNILETADLSVQTKDVLGFKTEDNEAGYRACCLGEAQLCINRLEGIELFINNKIFSGKMDTELDLTSYKKLNLTSPTGHFKKEFKYLNGDGSLANLNDNGYTWKQIAKIIRKNPRNVFTN